MSRLRSELERLFFLPGATASTHDAPGESPLKAEGRVRALVCELTGPSAWSMLQRLWMGVQTELGWPAPAIAVNGIDACQLWMPLSQPVLADQAHRMLQSLCAGHLADVPAHRLRLWPASEAQGHAMPPLVPAVCAPGDVWSAFVAPDLAPVFEDTPWLDVPPNLDGQAELLARISPLSQGDWQRAWAALRDGDAAERAPAMAPVDGAEAPARRRATETSEPAQLGHHEDPRAFLLAVMNADTVSLALRIEAAKALLHAPSVSS